MDELWHQNHALGMAAAADRTARNRLPGPVLARVRADNRERFPCKIKGCTRTRYKGHLCRGHWQMVPAIDRLDLSIATMTAAHRTAAKGHARFLRELQARLRKTAQIA
jgi:hypothetical protein